MLNTSGFFPVSAVGESAFGIIQKIKVYLTSFSNTWFASQFETCSILQG